MEQLYRNRRHFLHFKKYRFNQRKIQKIQFNKVYIDLNKLINF